MPSWRARCIEAQADDEQHAVGKVALLPEPLGVVGSVLFCVRPERLGKQVENGTRAETSEHSPELSLCFSLCHGRPLQVMVFSSSAVVPFTSRRNLTKNRCRFRQRFVSASSTPY